jgi:cytoskeletal protein RodZ
MHTIGSLLKNLRLKANLSITDISEKTNIAAHLLKSLEEDDFTHLPSSTYTKGFIKSYAEVVDLSPQKALAIFRRDFCITESGKIMPKGLAKPLDKPTVVGSKVLSILALACSLLIFFIYLFSQIKSYESAPTIDVLRPKPHTVVKGPIISVKGFVSADSSVYVNNSIVEVFPTGEFQASTQLPDGDHLITIKAVNAKNKISQIQIPVTVVDK